MELTPEDLSDMQDINNKDIDCLMTEEECLTVAIEGLLDLSYRSKEQNIDLAEAKDKVSRLRAEILHRAGINIKLSRVSYGCY